MTYSTKRSQLFVDQSALLREKPYARKSVSGGNTLFCMKLEIYNNYGNTDSVIMRGSRCPLRNRIWNTKLEFKKKNSIEWDIYC